MLARGSEPAPNLIRAAEDVAHVSVARDEPEGTLLAVAPDQDRWPGLLYGRRVVARVANGMTPARVRSRAAAHHLVEYSRRVFQQLHALCDCTELVAVRPKLVLVPAGPDARDGATVAYDVQRSPGLGQERRVAVRHTGDERPDAYLARACRQRGEGGQALELGPGGVGVIFMREREVILVPDGLEAFRLREPRDGEHPVESVLVSESFVGLYLPAKAHR